MGTVAQVLDFINVASDDDLESIKEALLNKGVNFDCPECCSHADDCDCDIETYVKDAKGEYVRSLIQRANQRGLADMVEELKADGLEVGIVMKDFTVGRLYEK